MVLLRRLLMGCLGFSGLAMAANSGLYLTDVGSPSATKPRVVVVDTPGVAREAFLFWEQSLESAGFDVWRADFSWVVDTPEKVLAALQQLDVVWAEQPYFVVAHGYGGRWAVEADLRAQKMVLVGVPLGPQLTPTIASVSVHPVQEGLPWPPDLLGGLPQEPLALALAQAYVDWGRIAPTQDPLAPVYLLASGRDVVGPPECNRLPSRAWTDRQFFRVDSFSFGEPTHGELLWDKAVLRKMIRFLEAP